MRYVTDAEKLIWNSGSPKELTLEFSNNKILDNSDICSESMTLTQTLADEDSFVYGKCSSAVFTIKVFTVNLKYKGLNVVPKLKVGTYTTTLGHFTVEEEKLSSDRSYKELTCYDSMCSLSNKTFENITISKDVTLAEYRTELFDKFDIDIVDEQKFNGHFLAQSELKKNVLTRSFTDYLVKGKKVVFSSDAEIISAHLFIDNPRVVDIRSMTISADKHSASITLPNGTDGFGNVDFEFKTDPSYLLLRNADDNNFLLPNDTMIVSNDVSNTRTTVLDVLQAICEVNACFGTINRDGKFEFVHLIGEDEALYPSDTLYPNDDLYPRDTISTTLTKSDYIQGSLEFEDYKVKQVTKVAIRDEDGQIGTQIGVDGNTYYITSNLLCYGKKETELNAIGNNFLSWSDFIEFEPTTVRTRFKHWMELGDYVKVISNTRIIKTPIMKRDISGITAIYETYSSNGNEYFSEDTTSVGYKIDELTNTTSKIIQTTDSISLSVSTLEGTVDDKCDKTDVCNQINISTESIELSGNRLIVDSDNFKLDANGNAEFSGNVDGATIKGSSFVNNNRTSMTDNINGLYIGDDGLDFCWVTKDDLDDDTTCHFRLSSNGFELIIGIETVMQASAKTRLNGGNIGKHIIVNTLVANQWLIYGLGCEQEDGLK